jgi:hypothetical protein
MLLKFYDNNRKPYAYCEDYKTIYTYEGKPVAYIDTKDIYAFNGTHVGFYEDGNIWDHNGDVLLFTKDSLRGPLKPSKALMPLKRLKSKIPLKGAKALKPKKPLKSKKWSTYSLNDIFVN